MFAASGDYQEARRYLEQALSVKPDFFPATMALARIEELEGHTDKAIMLYSETGEVGCRLRGTGAGAGAPGRSAG